MENIIISVTEKYQYTVAITEETKYFSNLSIKELVGSFRAQEKRIFFREDQPKETSFQSKNCEFSKFLRKSTEEESQARKEEGS